MRSIRFYQELPLCFCTTSAEQMKEQRGQKQTKEIRSKNKAKIHLSNYIENMMSFLSPLLFELWDNTNPS